MMRVDELPSDVFRSIRLDNLARVEDQCGDGGEFRRRILQVRMEVGEFRQG